MVSGGVLMSLNMYSTSKDNAEKIYAVYFSNEELKNSHAHVGFTKKEELDQNWPLLNNSRLVAINGDYGSGKSTVKSELQNKLETTDGDYTVIDFNALEFESKSQITSALYYEISKNISFGLKYKFRACGVLKTEASIKLISNDKIFFGALFALFIILITKYYNLFKYSLSPTIDIKYISLMLLSYAFIGIFIFKDSILARVAGLFPYMTHTDILEQVNIKLKSTKKQIILFIDEMDRLSPESLKLLLDEVLIINGKLTNNFRVFMFYDEHAVHDLLINCNIKRPTWYLQKFIESRYILSKSSFLLRLYESIPKIKYFKNPKRNTIPLARQFHVTPSMEVMKFIDENLTSFRDLERFIAYMQNLGESDRSLTFEFIGHGFDFDDTLPSNLFILTVFFKFKYKNSNILGKKKFVKQIRRKVVLILSPLYRFDDFNKVIDEWLNRIINPLFSLSQENDSVDRLISTATSKKDLIEMILSLIKNVELFDGKESSKIYLVNNDLSHINFDCQEFSNLIERITDSAITYSGIDLCRYPFHPEGYSRLSAIKVKARYYNFLNFLKYIILNFGNRDNIIYYLLKLRKNGRYDSIFIIVLTDILENGKSDTVNEYYKFIKPLTDLDQNEILSIISDLSVNSYLVLNAFSFHSIISIERMTDVKIKATNLVEHLEITNPEVEYDILLLFFWVANFNENQYLEEYQSLYSRAIINLEKSYFFGDLKPHIILFCKNNSIKFKGQYGEALNKVIEYLNLL